MAPARADSRLVGLEDFRLTAASFERLGARPARASVELHCYRITRAVVLLKPAERQRYLARRADGWVARICRTGLAVAVEGRHSLGERRGWFELPTQLEVRGPAREIARVARMPGVNLVRVTAIEGRHLRRRRIEKAPEYWFCVRALVAIEIEDETRGIQTTEDRFVVLRAAAFEEAEQRLEQHWRDYATPYLNKYGQLVRWQLQRVVDVYETHDEEPDPAGWEVFSKLGGRRMRPALAWRPRRAARQGRRPG